MLFDIGGVLEVVDDDTWPHTLTEMWSDRVGMEVDAFRTALAAADLPRTDITDGTEDAYWQGVGLALGIDSAACQVMRSELWDAYCGTANRELIDFAAMLRPRAGVAILSNSADGAREEEERRFGFSEVFHPICYSHEQGVNKPDPRAFELALTRMGADPARVLFVDDHETNVSAAEELGLAAVLHRDNATTIRAIDAFLARAA